MPSASPDRINLFLYGTLRHGPLYHAVSGQPLVANPATLADFVVTGVQDDVVPTIRSQPNATAEGVVVHDVGGAALERLDLFESAWGYTLTDVVVVSEGQEIAARVYLPPEGQQPDGKPWSLDDWAARNAAPVTHLATELFSRDPLPDADTLRSLWPMAEKRAWARVRAETRTGQPATYRFSPQPEDVEIPQKAAPLGRFFALQGFQVQHRQFDGALSPELTREVFLGIDASLVLPYDPATDQVLLVEQFRAAPAELGDPNPWVLEPIAGMVDAGETPQEAAHREAEEEAGLTNLTLEHIASFYPSPGSSTDYFHAYLGLCDLSGWTRTTGGLEDEHEDLRLHVLPFQKAFDLIASGELTAGPIMLMLLWLDRWRTANA